MTEPTSLELPAGARCAIHPERAAKVTCSRCGNFACESCEIVGENGAVLCKACEDAADDGRRIPWEERATRGIPRAFAETVRDVIVRPWELFAARPREASMLPALFFAWVVVLPGNVLGTITNLLTLDSTRAMYLSNPLLREYVWLTEPPFYLALGLGSLLLFPLILWINAALWHLSLMVFSATTRSIVDTARALSYAQAVGLLMILITPLIAVLNLVGLAAIGGFLALPLGIYAYVVSGIAMWKMHRCDGWRVFAAVGAQWLFFLVIGCLCAGILIFAILQTVRVPM